MTELVYGEESYRIMAACFEVCAYFAGNRLTCYLTIRRR
jgi:hypothetical protein